MIFTIWFFFQSFFFLSSPTPHSITFWKLFFNLSSSAIFFFFLHNIFHFLAGTPPTTSRSLRDVISHCSPHSRNTTYIHIMHVMRSNWTTSNNSTIISSFTSFDVKCNCCNCCWLALFILRLATPALLHHSKWCWIVSPTMLGQSGLLVFVSMLFLIITRVFQSAVGWNERDEKLSSSFFRVFVCWEKFLNTSTTSRVSSSRHDNETFSSVRNFHVFSFLYESSEFIRALKLSQRINTHQKWNEYCQFWIFSEQPTIVYSHERSKWRWTI